MEFKGTKGGWKYYHELGDNKIISVNHQFIISNLTGTGLFVTSPNTNPHHKEANALLISKAPEMLEMLERAKVELSRIKCSMMAHPDCTEGSEFDDYTSSAQDVENDIEQLIKEATEL